MGLATVEGCLGHEAGEIFVIRPDFDSRGSFEVMAPFFEASDDGEELLVVYWVINLGSRKLLRTVYNRVPSVLLFEGQDAREGTTRRI